MPGLMRGGWKRGRVSGLPSLQRCAWTAPDHHDYRASLLLYKQSPEFAGFWHSHQRVPKPQA
jgi:hypothetical protein